ncbi:hypothetical protein C8R46DRAFT_1164672 [Mycena filopes]|nr:hypothetical protein C8R46DRAFT_1164672 [Mycena filopes]
MPNYSLRPVNQSPSPSPTTASASPPAYKGPASPPPPPPRSRRPLSPSSLRGECHSHPRTLTIKLELLTADVDLTHMPDMPPRRYPAPPTGHDLMAMFPPAAPDNFAELTRPGPTSGYFQRQERAFFAQAGKEIVRVRVDVDHPHPDDALPPTNAVSGKGGGGRRPWPPSGTASPAQGPPAQLYPRPRGTSTLPATPVFPPAPHPHPHAHPHSHSHTPHPHAPHAPPRAASVAPPGDDDRDRDRDSDYRPGSDDPDEAWRRPMPYNERRRAGKHTRRVVVQRN